MLAGRRHPWWKYEDMCLEWPLFLDSENAIQGSRLTGGGTSGVKVEGPLSAPGPLRGLRGSKEGEVF